jgi:hypothetical protein
MHCDAVILPCMSFRRSFRLVCGCDVSVPQNLEWPGTAHPGNDLQSSEASNPASGHAVIPPCMSFRQLQVLNQNLH